MIGKLGLAAAVAGILLLAQPGGAVAASLSLAGTGVSPQSSDTVTAVSHRKKWRKWRKHRRHVHYGRYHNYRYRERYHTYYSYSYPTYYVYRPYRHYRHHYRRHRPHIGIYLSF
jgi:hypothetical protein